MSDIGAILFAGLIGLLLAFPFLDAESYWLTGESLHHAFLYRGANEKIGCSPACG